MKKASSNIFRAHDIRGTYGEDISLDIFLELGKAFGTYVKRQGQSKVTIGCDIRASTQVLLFSFISGVILYFIVREVIPEKEKGKPFYFLIGVISFSLIVIIIKALGYSLLTA